MKKPAAAAASNVSAVRFANRARYRASREAARGAGVQNNNRKGSMASEKSAAAQAAAMWRLIWRGVKRRNDVYRRPLLNPAPKR